MHPRLLGPVSYTHLEAAIDEIGTTAYLTFREGSSVDGELILDGSMIESAAAQYLSLIHI